MLAAAPGRVRRGLAALLCLASILVLLVSPPARAVDGPRIDSVSPGLAAIGDAVSALGAGFGDGTSGSVVRVNGVQAQVVAVDPGVIRFTVPPVASGPVTVEVGGGVATSPSPLYVAPPPRGVADVGSTSHATVGGAAAAVRVPSSGQVGLVTFAGSVGQRVVVEVPSLVALPAAASVPVDVLAPDGARVHAFRAARGSSTSLPALPTDGTYSLLVDPEGDATLTMSVALHGVASEADPAAGIGGPQVLVRVETPGRTAQVAVEAAAGQRFAVEVLDADLGGATATLVAPGGGTAVAATAVVPGAWLEPVVVPAGRHVVMLDPPDGATGTVRLRVHSLLGDLIAPADLEGQDAQVDLRAPGRNAQVTFPLPAGTRLAVALSSREVSSVKVSLRLSNGSVRPGATVPGTGFVEFGAVSTGGDAALLLDPVGLTTGLIAVDLIAVPADVDVPLVIDGAAAVVETVRGQNALLAFDAVAGQSVTVHLAGAPLPSAAVLVRRPNGSTQVSTTAASPGRTVSVTPSATGRHTVLVDPSGTGAGTWSAEVIRGLAPPLLSSATHPAAATWYGTAPVTFSWTPPANGAANAYSVLLDRAPQTVGAAEPTQTSTTWSGAVPDGVSYLHVRARGTDGVWGRTAHREIRVDTTRPDPLAVTSSSHPDQEAWSATAAFRVCWTAPQDVSGIDHYDVVVSDLGRTDRERGDFVTFGSCHAGSLAGDGEWFVHVRAVDRAGNRGEFRAYRLLLDTRPPAAPVVTSSTHPVPGRAEAASRLLASWEPGQEDPTVVGWHVVVDRDPITDPVGAVQRRRTVAADLQPGRSYLHVRGVDAAGRPGDTTHYPLDAAPPPARVVTPRPAQALFGEVEVGVVLPAAGREIRVEAQRTPAAPGGLWQAVAPAAVTGPDGAARTTWRVEETATAGRRWPDGPYRLRVVSAADGAVLVDGPEVTVSAALTADERVRAAFAAGDLTVDDAARLGVYAVLNPARLPAQFRPTDEQAAAQQHGGVPDLLALWDDIGDATRDELARFITPGGEPPGTPPTQAGDCDRAFDVLGDVFDCRAVYDLPLRAGSERIRFDVVYRSDSLPDAPDADGNGRHDRVDFLSNAIVQAWGHYDRLGFRVPSDRLLVVLNPLGFEGAGLSLPELPIGMSGLRTQRTVFLSSDPSVTAYLPRHELFHQVQYEYVSWSDIAVHPGDTIWWMEATAEWGAHQVNDALGAVPRDDYANELADSLAVPERPINFSDDLQLGPEYGAFLLAEFLEERDFGADSTGPATIERLWDAISSGLLPRSPTPTLAAFVADRGSSFARELVAYRQWSYVLDRNETHDVGFRDPAVAGWRVVLDEDSPATATPPSRPRREEVTLAVGDVRDGGGVLYQSGAAYIDFALTSGPGSVTIQVGAHEPTVEAHVLAFSTYPTLCRAPTPVAMSGGGGTVTVQLGSGCNSATLMVVDPRIPRSPRGTLFTWQASAVLEPDDELTEVVEAPDGSVYVAGRVRSGSLRLGDQTLSVPSGGVTSFIARRESDGHWSWIAPIRGDATVNGLVADAGGVYAVGSFIGTTTFAASTFNAGSATAGFAVRLTPSGAWEWIRPFTAAAPSNRPVTAALAVAGAGADGGLWVSGYLAGTLQYDGAATGTSAGYAYAGTGGLLLRIGSDGGLHGSWQLGAGYNSVTFRDLAVGLGERVYLVGSLGARSSANRVTVNGYALPSDSHASRFSNNGLVVEFDSATAAFTWGLSARGRDDGHCDADAGLGSVAVDQATGNLLVGGSTRCAVALYDRGDSGERLPDGRRDYTEVGGDPFWGNSAFVAMVDPDADLDPEGRRWGRWRWSAALGTGVGVGLCGSACGTFAVPEIAIDDGGHAYLAASAEGGVRRPRAVGFDNTIAPAREDTEVVVMRYNLGATMGELEWIDRLPSPATGDVLRGAALGRDRVLLAGAFTGHTGSGADVFAPDRPDVYEVLLGGPVHRGGIQDAFLAARDR